MGRKRDRPQPQVDEQQQEEEQTPSPSSMPPKTKRGRSEEQLNLADEQQQEEEQMKLADEQEQEQEDEQDGDGDGDESDTDSKDNSQNVKESNKSAAKTKTDEQEKAVAVVAEEDEKKPPIISNRLWSSDDEIIVLQSVIDFKDEFNKDAAANGDAFFHFVKDKFHYTNFSKSQVMDKLRKLKNKYKKSFSAKHKDPRCSNPHDLKSYQLSNTIWGNLDANNKAAASSDHVKTEERVDDENKGRVEKDVLKPEEEENDFRRLYPHLIGGGFEGESSLHSVTLLDGCKTYLGNVDSKLLEEWDENWRKVRIAETSAYLSRLALIQEQTTWFRNHMKSS